MKTIEILFRAKNKDGKWIYGMPTYNFEFIFDTNNVDSVDNYRIDKETLGQFTGLTDKNGTKIFEGDIIRCYQAEENTVFWYEEDGSWCISNCHAGALPLGDYYRSSEIIGNIFDNPELL